MPTQVFTASPAYNHQYSVSGGSGYHLSGMSSASATTSGLNGYNSSGPWLIEEQSMTIDYFRVPSWVTRQDVTSQDFALSGGNPTSIVSGNIMGTKIAARVEAFVKRVKSYDTYQTSSYNQPQRFTVAPNSTDVNGLSYGNITVGKLGPAGNIITTQKYYNRRPWVEGVDSTYDKAAAGFTWYHMGLTHVSSVPGLGASSIEASVAHQDFAMGDFSKFMGQEFAYAELTPGGGGAHGYVFPRSMSNMGALQGGYNVANEQTTLATTVIDQCGQFFEWNGWGLYNHDYADTNVPSGGYTDFGDMLYKYQGSLSKYDNTPTEYSVSRHDFS